MISAMNRPVELRLLIDEIAPSEASTMRAAGAVMSTFWLAVS